MNKTTTKTAPLATYEAMRAWYLADGRAVVAARAKAARAAGRALTTSLEVEPRLMDESVTY